MNTREILNFTLENAEAIDTDLGILANKRRLIILAHLLDAGELPVNEILNRLDLTQSALSQHLALMRAHRIVATRRDGTVIYYSLVSQRIRTILKLLPEIFLQTLDKNMFYEHKQPVITSTSGTH